VSTATPQSLMLMNSDFVLENAKLLAARLVAEAGADQTAQIQLAWQLAFNRAPSSEEQQAAQDFFTEQIANFSAVPTKETDPAKKPDPLVWARTTFCQALFSSNEFLYVD
jgi:hypothetical protein